MHDKAMHTMTAGAGRTVLLRGTRNWKRFVVLSLIVLSLSLYVLPLALIGLLFGYDSVLSIVIAASWRDGMERILVGLWMITCAIGGLVGMPSLIVCCIGLLQPGLIVRYAKILRIGLVFGIVGASAFVLFFLASIVPNIIASKLFADDDWKSCALFIAGPMVFVVIATVLILDINSRLKARNLSVPPLSN